MWQIYGQPHILTQLDAGLKGGRMAHAYLLVGPPHVGKMTLAIRIAQALNCLQGCGEPCGECAQCTRIALGQHADVRVVGIGPSEEDGPTRTVIRIEDVKDADQKNGILRSNGLKVEQLKGELEMALKGGHH